MKFILCMRPGLRSLLAPILVLWAVAARSDEIRTFSFLPLSDGGAPQLISYDPGTSTLADLLPLIGIRFWDEGVFGQGATVANVEGGYAWSGHETLIHIPTNQWFAGEGVTGTPTAHATATAHIIAGLGPTNHLGQYYLLSLGLAPLVDLWSGDVATGFGENGSFSITSASLFSAYEFAFGQADVINSSWGGSGEGTVSGSDLYTVALDAMARTHPTTTFVIAAGNHDPSKSEDPSVVFPASGFNGISVGALATAHTYESVASFSNYGPGDFYNPLTDTLISGVRATVDLSAPGTYIGAAYSTNDPLAYAAFSGTSAAAPIIAGGAALMVSASTILEANPSAVSNGWTSSARDSRVIKAVLMNTADRLAGWSNESALLDHVDVTEYLGGGITLVTTFDGVQVTTQGVDYAQGSGRLNLDRAFDSYVGGQWLLNSIVAQSDQVWTFNQAWVAGETVTATLTWFADRQMTLGLDYSVETQVTDAENSVTNAALANLDLELWFWNEGLTQLYAASRSEYNNTEHLVFTVNDPGVYALRVVHAGMVFGESAEPETYALAWNVVPEPSMVVLLSLCLIPLSIRRYVRRRALRSAIQR